MRATPLEKIVGATSDNLPVCKSDDDDDDDDDDDIDFDYDKYHSYAKSTNQDKKKTNT